MFATVWCSYRLLLLLLIAAEWAKAQGTVEDLLLNDEGSGEEPSTVLHEGTNPSVEESDQLVDNLIPNLTPSSGNCRSNDADVVFMLDASGSMESIHEKHINWTRQLVTSLFTSTRPLTVRVALLQYTIKPQTEFTLNDGGDLAGAFGRMAALRAIIPGRTRTGAALKGAEIELYNERHGARRNAIKIIVIFTDGLSEDDPVKYAETLREKRDAKIFVINVGSDGFDSEIARIAGDHSHVFKSGDYKRLEDALISEICYEKESDKVGELPIEEARRTIVEKPFFDKHQNIDLPSNWPKTTSSHTTLGQSGEAGLAQLDETSSLKADELSRITAEQHNESEASELAGNAEAVNDEQAESFSEPKQDLQSSDQTGNAVIEVDSTATTIHQTEWSVALESTTIRLGNDSGEPQTDQQQPNQPTKEVVEAINEAEQQTELVDQRPPQENGATSGQRIEQIDAETTEDGGGRYGTPDVTDGLSKTADSTSRQSQVNETRTDEVKVLSSKSSKKHEQKQSWKQNASLKASNGARPEPVEPQSIRATGRNVGSGSTTVRTTASRQAAAAAQSEKKQRGPLCPREILFVLDSSGSVQKIYDQQKEFLQSVVNEMQIGPEEQRVALMQFAGSAHQRIEWSFDAFQDSKPLIEAINNIRHITGTTFIGRALITSLSFLEARRPNVPTIVVLISDGFSHDDASKPAEEIRKQPNVNFYALSIAELNNFDYLTKLTEDPTKVYVGTRSDELKQTLLKSLHCSRA